MSSLDTTFLAALLGTYVVYRQCVTRPVTRRDFILPIAGAIYLTVRYLQGPSTTSEIAVEVSATLGIASGLVAGGFVQLWRDAATNLVYQRGGWRYAVVLLALFVVHLLWREIGDYTGLTRGVAVLNDAFIALVLGNYLGRYLHIGARTLHLAGWQPHAIPTVREAKQRTASRHQQR